MDSFSSKPYCCPIPMTSSPSNHQIQSFQLFVCNPPTLLHRIAYQIACPWLSCVQLQIIARFYKSISHTNCLARTLLTFITVRRRDFEISFTRMWLSAILKASLKVHVTEPLSIGSRHTTSRLMLRNNAASMSTLRKKYKPNSLTTTRKWSFIVKQDPLKILSKG